MYLAGIADSSVVEGVEGGHRDIEGRARGGGAGGAEGEVRGGGRTVRHGVARPSDGAGRSVGGGERLVAGGLERGSEGMHAVIIPRAGRKRVVAGQHRLAVRTRQVD